MITEQQQRYLKAAGDLASAAIAFEGMRREMTGHAPDHPQMDSPFREEWDETEGLRGLVQWAQMVTFREAGVPSRTYNWTIIGGWEQVLGGRALTLRGAE